jgi:bacteriophage CI repressor helix-turn-helix domain
MNEDIKKKIGNKIAELRRENNLSQKNFGEKLGVSQDTVSLWEKGKSLPATEYVIEIAQLFQLSTDELLCLKDY